MVLDGGVAIHHVKLVYMVAHTLHHIDSTFSPLHGETKDSPSKAGLHGARYVYMVAVCAGTM